MYELSMLSQHQKFLITTPLPAIAVTHWKVAYTGGHHVTIPVGTILTVIDDQIPSAPGVGCMPDDYAKLEEDLIPVVDRTAVKYTGFSLSILVADLLSHSQEI
jgi:hypothetical protein